MAKMRSCLNDREKHGRPVPEADKVDYLRQAIVDEPRHGSTWELTLLNPPYNNDFEASACIVTSAYAPKAKPVDSNASQRHIAANTSFAAPNNNANNRAKPKGNFKQNNNSNRSNNNSNRNSNSNGNNGTPRASAFDPANPVQMYHWKAWRTFTPAQKKIVLDGRAAQQGNNRPANRRNNSATNRSTDPGDNVEAPNNPSVGAQMEGRASS